MYSDLSESQHVTASWSNRVGFDNQARAGGRMEVYAHEVDNGAQDTARSLTRFTRHLNQGV